MLDYLKRAFWAGPQVTGLGRLPLNVLGLVGFGILGLGDPAFWLLGAGLEAAYLATLVSHPRFQRLVNAERRGLATTEAEQGRRDLVQRLEAPARQRFANLEAKCHRVLELAREAQAGEFELESSRDAFERLLWVYLKLLVASGHLMASRERASDADLQKKIAVLERDLGTGDAPPALRESQTATLKLLKQRLENLDHCQDRLQQADADLARIEAQVDLALESTTIRGGGAGVAATLELASQTLADGLEFGESEATVMALDKAYGAPVQTRVRV